MEKNNDELKKLINELICLSGLRTIAGKEQNLFRSFGRLQIQEKVLTDPDIIKLKSKVVAIARGIANA